MPPKQVYGKRVKPATTGAASYAKFLSSPDMDGGKGVMKKDVEDLEKGLRDIELQKNDEVAEQEEVVGGRSKRKKKKQASETPKEQEIDGIEEVEKQLQGISLQPDNVEEEIPGSLPGFQEKETERPSRPSTAKSAVSVEIPTKPRIESSSVDEEIHIFDEKGNRTGKVSRKALEERNANAGVKNREMKVRDKKTKEKETANKAKHAFVLEQTSNKTGEELAPTRVIPESPTENHVADITLPGTKSAKSKKQGPAPMPRSDDLYTAYASPLLALTDQREIISFDEWSKNIDDCVNVEKIAEASFSEVYRLTVKDPISGSANESVLKLVGLRMPEEAPLPSESVQVDRPRRKGDEKAQLKKEMQKRQEDNEWKSHVNDVLGEVRLLQNLNYIPGFTIFRDITILQGRPSSSFSRAWKDWNKARPKGKKSHYPDPSKKTSYEDTQLWAVIEMQDAGTDCGKIIESGGITTIWEVWDIFWGVCLSVAKAEEACRFEHRDMHMDNICVRSSDKNKSLTEPRIKNPLKRKLGFTNLETTVIDYTLSRADIVISESRRSSLSSSTSTDSRPSTPWSQSHCGYEVAYLDLGKDQSLFEGDAEEEYQYEIYRYMWGAVYHNDPLNQDPVDSQDSHDCRPETPRRSPRKRDQYSTPRRSPRKSHAPQLPPKDIWRRFFPKTNLVWAHFILYCLLQNLRESGNEPAHLSIEDVISNIDGKDDIQRIDAEKIYRKAVKLHKILVKVASLLEPEMLGKKSRLDSMRAVVIVALEAGWLGAGDVSGKSS